MQNENSNSHMEKWCERRGCCLQTENKHHINKRENNDKQELFKRTHNTGQHLRQKNKQQTTKKCRNIETKANKQYPKYKQPKTTNKWLCRNKTSNKTTEMIMIRTTWPLFANANYKTYMNRKANNDKQHLFNKNTTQDRHTAK